jgi:hypothetical protein
MIIIGSGAYVGREFQIEVGKLPPALLPLGNRRLFQHQIDILKSTFREDIFISLPESFVLSEKDKIAFKNDKVEIVFVPDGLSLADSILYVVNSIGRYEEPLRLIHGDTLLDAFPTNDNMIGVALAEDDYEWQIEATTSGKELVWCGYFCFSDIGELAKSLVNSRGDFAKAVQLYNHHRPLTKIECTAWFDFGHINTFFKSRAKVTTQRAFNQIQIDKGIVRKSGQPNSKISAEGAWFASLPPDAKRFTPQLFERGTDQHGSAFYKIEYLCLLPLNELYVHGRNSPSYWTRIFDRTRDVMKTFKNTPIKECTFQDVIKDVDGMLRHKTWSRLENFSETRQFDLDAPVSCNNLALPSVRTIVSDCLNRCTMLPSVPSLVHGHLCLSNMLYEARADHIKLLDPRGLNSKNEETIFGDQIYDLAKFSHSIVGLYDYIMAGAYTLSIKNRHDFSLSIDIDYRVEIIIENFLHYKMIGDNTASKVMPMTILLFFSMLPLHYDDEERQGALLANALRLYGKYIV